MRAAVAAGHPATVDAGVEILEDGGNAADAAVAASLASCVAETVMTGLLGGGHAAVYWEGEVRMLDFFVAVPGLGVDRREVELVHLEVPFGTELVHYAIGVGSCAVPGVLPELVAAEGGRSPSLERALLELMADLGGLVTVEDLRLYEALWREPVEAEFAG